MLDIEINGISDKQKLQAIEFRYYQGSLWTPKVGDYYTIIRADNQLCRIVGEDDENFFILLSWPDGQKSKEPSPFPKQGFCTEGFGLNRIYCPDWLFKN